MLKSYLVKSKPHEKLKTIPALQQQQQQPQTKKGAFDIAAACTNELAIAVAAAVRLTIQSLLQCLRGEVNFRLSVC